MVVESSSDDRCFSASVAFLEKHVSLVILKSPDGRAQVAVAPEYQGRVMTSTAAGPGGMSFGWINRDVVEKNEKQPHMTVLGGEDRFWLGPEGGQFSLYFPPDVPFDFEHWQVPEPIDWGAWKTASRSDREVVLAQSMKVSNRLGAEFSISVRRTIRLLDERSIERHLGTTPGANTLAVAFESDNVLTNRGTEAWSPERGLVSIWILGMFAPSAETTVVIPVQSGDDDEIGPPVRDDYFGAVGPSRLKVDGDVVFFRGDGKSRGKIGIAQGRALPVAGSYDAENHILTIIQFSLPPQANRYVDSRWKQQEFPYAGDVINSYNDGPPEPGKKPLGPFYEIESSSPAASLEPGQALAHVHRTIHLQGPESELEPIAEQVLRVSLKKTRGIFQEQRPNGL